MSRTSDASEQEAKSAARKLARGEPAPAVRAKPRGAIQRDNDGTSAGDLDWNEFFGAQSKEEPLSTRYPEVDESCVSASLFGMVPDEDSNAGGAQTNFTITDCGDEVVVDLPFRVDASQAGVVGRYEEGILDVLDNQYQLTDPDGSIHGVRVNPSFQVGHRKGDSAYFNDIRNAEDSLRGAGIVDMNYFPTLERDRPEGAGDAWERTSPDSIENSAAHEAAHRLLIPDRYGRPAADFESIADRPPEPWEVDKKASPNGAATYQQRNNLMGDNVPILPENGLDGLLPYIDELRGIPSISSLQYPPEYPVCEPGWPQ